MGRSIERSLRDADASDVRRGNADIVRAGTILARQQQQAQLAWELKRAPERSGSGNTERRRPRGREPHSSRPARASRASRDGREEDFPDAHDVMLALNGQGYRRTEAKRAAQASKGSDFDALFPGAQRAI